MACETDFVRHFPSRQVSCLSSLPLGLKVFCGESNAFTTAVTNPIVQFNRDDVHAVNPRLRVLEYVLLGSLNVHFQKFTRSTPYSAINLSKVTPVTFHAFFRLRIFVSNLSAKSCVSVTGVEDIDGLVFFPKRYLHRRYVGIRCAVFLLSISKFERSGSIAMILASGNLLAYKTDARPMSPPASTITRGGSSNSDSYGRLSKMSRHSATSVVLARR